MTAPRRAPYHPPHATPGAPRAHEATTPGTLPGASRPGRVRAATRGGDVADSAARQATTAAQLPAIPPRHVRVFDRIDLERNRRMNLFLDAYRLTGDWARSAQLVGVHRDTPRGWGESFPTFLEAVKEAVEDRLDRHAGMIVRIADDIDHKDCLRASLALLTKERPAEWGRVLRADSGAMLPTLPNAVAMIPADELQLLSLRRVEHDAPRTVKAHVIEGPDGGVAPDPAAPPP